uniref:Uncharacterized protein n=1 Tax=Rhizophora mucronata TaxID=61149 RepID=A0A2P2PRX5_RHIMU
MFYDGRYSIYFLFQSFPVDYLQCLIRQE